MDVRRIDTSIDFNATAFQRRVIAWNAKHGRDLPWRHTRDPYAVLVSELMLQQTQVATVIPYYERWLARFPDFVTLAAASESDVLHAWQGLGYYARARNLHAAAKAVANEHGGTLPTSPGEMQKLPGLGRYTANAVATFAFDQSVPIVEANTARLFARLSNLQLRIDSGAGRDALWQFAAFLVPQQNAGTFNSAVMDLGAMICVAGEPKCGECPVRRFCQAVNPAKLPLKQPRAVLKKLQEPHQFIRRFDSVLLEKSTDRWRGMWILPRLAEPAADARLLHRSHFPFTHHRVTLDVFDAENVPASPSHQWFGLNELDSIPLPSPHRRALQSILRQNSEPAPLTRLRAD